jgi:hypothetical protein
MPILGALLVTLFGQLASFFVEILAKKVAIAVAFAATLATVMGVMLALLSVVIVPVANAIFASFPYTGWMGLMFPTTATSVCITALATTWSGTVLYAWQREALRIAASV